MDTRVGLQRKLSAEESMLLNCDMEKTLESPLDSKEIQPVPPKGNQSWIWIGRTDVEAETPILWPPDGKNQLIGKDPDLGKIEGKRRRGWQRMRWLDGITNSMDMSLSKLWELVIEGRPGVLQSMVSQRVRHDWATELTDWLWECVEYLWIFHFSPCSEKTSHQLRIWTGEQVLGLFNLLLTRQYLYMIWNTNRVKAQRITPLLPIVHQLSNSSPWGQPGPWSGWPLSKRLA